MPGINDFFSEKRKPTNYGKSTYSSVSTYTPSYPTSNETNYEKNMQKYLYFSTVCSSSGISCSGYSNDSRDISRTGIIRQPSESTNFGIY